MQGFFIFIAVVAILFVLALPYLASLALYALPAAVLWWSSNFPKGEGPKLEDVSDQDGDAILKRVEKQKGAAEQRIKSELRRGFSSNVHFIEQENRFENRSNLGQELNRLIRASSAEIEQLDSDIELLADPQLRRHLAWRNNYIHWRELGRYKTAVIGAVLATAIGLAALEFFDPALTTVYAPGFISPAITYSSLFGWAGGLLGLYIGRRRHASLAEDEILNMDTTTNAENVSQEGPAEDWPEILGVPSDASSDDIRKAYTTAIRRCHPDIVASMSESIQEAALSETQRLNDAYRRARELRDF